jgi:hypothetical protein
MSKPTVQPVISGPYKQYSFPYGKATCGRNEWWVSRPLRPGEPGPFGFADEKERVLGKIIQFDGQDNRFVINQAWPGVDLPTLEEAVQWLMDNEGKWTACS